MMNCCPSFSDILPNTVRARVSAPPPPSTGRQPEQAWSGTPLAIGRHPAALPKSRAPFPAEQSLDASSLVEFLTFCLHVAAHGRFEPLRIFQPHFGIDEARRGGAPWGARHARL